MWEEILGWSGPVGLGAFFAGLGVFWWGLRQLGEVPRRSWKTREKPEP